MIKLDGGIAEPLRRPSMGTNVGDHYAIEKPLLSFLWVVQPQESKLVDTCFEGRGSEISRTLLLKYQLAIPLELNRVNRPLNDVTRSDLVVV